jgi:hypothetical protein
METKMDPKDAAKAILNIFITEFHLRADQTCMMPSIEAKWEKRDIPSPDLQTGLQYGLGNGWFQITGDDVTMTAEGFAEAQ